MMQGESLIQTLWIITAYVNSNSSVLMYAYIQNSKENPKLLKTFSPELCFIYRGRSGGSRHWGSSDPDSNSRRWLSSHATLGS